MQFLSVLACHVTIQKKGAVLDGTRNPEDRDPEDVCAHADSHATDSLGPMPLNSETPCNFKMKCMLKLWTQASC